MDVAFNNTVDFTKDKLDYIGTNIDYCCDENFAIVYTSERRMKRQIKRLSETTSVEFIEERLFANNQSEWKVKIPWLNITISA